MRIAKVDANQREIVEGLRKLGYSVAIISSVGNGIPDLIVGKGGVNFLFEVKDGNKCPSQQKLTERERIFFDQWRGQVDVVRSLDDAFRLLSGGILDGKMEQEGEDCP